MFSCSSQIAILIMATLLASVFSWKYIEQPFRNKERINRRQVITFGVVATVLCITFGITANMSKGFIDRYPSSDHQLLRTNKQFVDYVEKYYFNYKRVPFEDNGKFKVLIVGDSYAEDLVNAILESKLTAHIQISTHYISAACGNLLLDTEFIQYVEEKYRRMCRDEGWYENVKLQRLIKSSDFIWLSSAWQNWHMEYLSTSIENIEKITDAKILVFGTKNFGEINLQNLLNLDVSKRYQIRNEVDKSIAEVNALMAKILPNDMFIDVLNLLCNSQSACSIFVNKQLITYDGAHLTQEGARYFGEKLQFHPLIQDIVNN